MSNVVFSPSNMGTYATCALRFFGQAIAKDIKWTASAEKSRGTNVHEWVELALNSGIEKVTVALPPGVDVQYLHTKINNERERALSRSGVIRTEHELCINGTLKATGWWDKDAWLRAKADAVTLLQPLPPAKKGADTLDVSAKVIDIKTGKKWDEDALQLRIEALLVHLIYKRPVVEYEYWYVDSGETVDGIIDFRQGLGPVADIISLLKDMKQSMTISHFPAKKNKFCKWCAYHGTPKCGL